MRASLEKLQITKDKADCISYYTHRYIKIPVYSYFY